MTRECLNIVLSSLVYNKCFMVISFLGKRPTLFLPLTLKLPFSVRLWKECNSTNMFCDFFWQCCTQWVKKYRIFCPVNEWRWVNVADKKTDYSGIVGSIKNATNAKCHITNMKNSQNEKFTKNYEKFH